MENKESPRGQQYTTISGLPQVIEGLTRSVNHSQFQTSSGKSSSANAEKGIKQRWGSIRTVFEGKENMVVLAAALDPRYKKLTFLAPEDVIRVQGTIEVLAVKEEAKAGTGEFTQLQRADDSGVVEKSALDVLLQSDTESDDESEQEEEDAQDRRVQIVRGEVKVYL
uniref:Uncharacterized protein n=1 Tax=Nothobranchius rachovii TaxID=451742 RepID=A0A1A8SJV0_9TELE